MRHVDFWEKRLKEANQNAIETVTSWIKYNSLNFERVLSTLKDINFKRIDLSKKLELAKDSELFKE